MMLVITVLILVGFYTTTAMMADRYWRKISFLGKLLLWLSLFVF